MAAKGRVPGNAVMNSTGRDLDPLSSVLFNEPYRFDFFQAVRLLEKIYPELKPLGYHFNPKEEVVKLKAHLSLAFPASQIQDLKEPDLDELSSSHMWVTFMGMAGPLGALPQHYTEMLVDPRARKETEALREFLDLFNHRFLSLFYRAWEKYRFPVAYERKGEDKFSRYLFSLIGMGTKGLRNRLEVSDQILLFYAGLLSQKPRSAVALEGMLNDYFDVPIEVQQFQGEWFLMNEESLTKLGRPGQNTQLGNNAVLWERVWDPQARFRIVVGPLTYLQFKQFLPVGSAYLHLVELTRFFVGEEFNFEVQLVLKAAEVPDCVLSKDQGTRLGWSMWLKTRDFESDTEQPVLEMRVARK